MSGVNPGRLLARIRSGILWILTSPIRFYQRFISPLIAPRCRYAPTCSAYAIEAITVHGPFKGLLLGSWRLLRCNPWSHGGVDHVPAKGRWRPEPWIPPEDWAGNATDIVRPTPMGLEDLVPAEGPGIRDAAPAQGPALAPDFPPATAGCPQGALGARSA